MVRHRRRGTGRAACTDEHTVHAYVVALDQVITLNRLGANMPQGMMFALANDVFPTGTNPQQQTLQNSCRFKSCAAGSVMLGTYKRPRPLVLRVDEGDCLDIHFVNLLSPTPQPNQGKTTKAGPHVQGLNWVRGPQDDASFVGANPSSLFPPGSTPGGATGWTEYELYAEHEGSYLLYSTADDWTPVPGGGDGGTLAQGLFGAVTVQPSGYRFHENERGEKLASKERPWQAEFYRSQVTEQDICLASADQKAQGGTCYRTKPEELPTLDFQALYPAGSPREFLPILNMVCTKQLTPDAIAHGACLQNELVHGDLTAMITGPSHQQPGFAFPQPRAFPNAPNPDQQPPSLRPIYAYPDRLQPYREFTIIYHESFQVTQAFPGCFNKLGSLDAAGDNFGINYGMSGLSAEVLANRLAVGPVSGCTDCKFEEFFLSSWALGDPAMNVDWPTTGCVDNNCNPKACAKASQAYYPDDPSNVYHAYIADHVRFRILHGGSDLHHLHHQHAQQWLGRPTRRTATTSTASRSARAPPSPWRWSTTAPATSTRWWGTRSSTATSTPTSPPACGRCGAATTSSRAARSSSTASPPTVPTRRPAAPTSPAPCPTARSPAARRRRRWCRCPPCRWRRCPPPCSCRASARAAR